MKTLRLRQIKCLLLVVSVVLSACYNYDITLYYGPADLTITNLTTGVSQQETSTLTIGERDTIVFKHGDVLQLKFTPPEEYKKKSFSVDFHVLDKTPTITSSPYIYEITIDEDVPVGSYPVVCSAMCEEWDEGSSCVQIIYFRVEK